MLRSRPTAIEAMLIVKHLSARRTIHYNSQYFCIRLTNSLRAPERTNGSVGGIQAKRGATRAEPGVTGGVETSLTTRDVPNFSNTRALCVGIVVVSLS